MPSLQVCTHSNCMIDNEMVYYTSETVMVRNVNIKIFVVSISSECNLLLSMKLINVIVK